MAKATAQSPPIDVELNAVILAVTDEVPRVLTVGGDRAGGSAPPALPSGNLDVNRDRTLDRGARRWVREQTGLEVGYVEQLYTFGDRGRHPEERAGGRRVLAIAYLALVREERPSQGAAWRDVYGHFPIEDHREGPPQVLLEAALPAIDAWITGADSSAQRQVRRERAHAAFALDGTTWDPVRVLERYELLYEVGSIAEAGARTDALGTTMRLDHRRMLAAALGRLRGKLTYRPVVFELLPEKFTLLQLQSVVEALSGTRLHKQNFRRLAERGGLVEGTGQLAESTGGRPPELFRFRREVLLERPRPGVGVPGGRG
jgi:hypothetical protein